MTHTWHWRRRQQAVFVLTACSALTCWSNGEDTVCAAVTSVGHLLLVHTCRQLLAVVVSRYFRVVAEHLLVVQRAAGLVRAPGMHSRIKGKVW